MKPLVVSLACAVGLSTAGYCGDLGNADIATRSEAKTQLSFSANCYGPLDEPRGPECKVNFVDGKMSVNGSAGITPGQITYIKNGWVSNGYYISIQYTTSDGDVSLGQFSFYEKPVAKEFLNTVIAFKSNNIVIDAEPAIQEEEGFAINEPNETYEYKECEGPSILCFDMATREAESLEEEPSVNNDIDTGNIEEKLQVEVIEVDSEKSDIQNTTEQDECTGPTILCF